METSVMLDLLFIVVGAGSLAVLAGYAFALNRL
jgi:hypothetical protein